MWGTPPAGRADYAFQQHIVKSLELGNGRSLVLWPYGVLFRDAERQMREKMIKDDLVECVIALGKNLFYNSIMESCLLLCRNNKPEHSKSKILFIDARNELRKEKTMSFLDEHHIQKILDAYQQYDTIEGFSYLANMEEVLKNEASLNIPLYVMPKKDSNKQSVNDVFDEWVKSSESLASSMNDLFEKI
jgi:type I restriction enzyme M protein